MVHAIRHAERPHPDANRIVGISLAITFNTALLMLLLVPIVAPPGLNLPDVVAPIRWILPRTLPTPPPPIPVPIVKQPPQPTPDVIRPQTTTPQAEAQVIVDQGSQQAIETPVPTNSPASIEASPTPLPGVRLEYADAPAPSYPRDALREGVEGTVMLQVLVDADGRPLDVQIQHSSGNRQLDLAARRQVLERWRFRPAMKDGRAVQAIGLVPIAFHLDR